MKKLLKFTRDYDVVKAESGEKNVGVKRSRSAHIFYGCPILS